MFGFLVVQLLASTLMVAPGSLQGRKKPKMPTPEVVTALKSTVGGAWEELPTGTIDTITPMLPTGATVPRGRIYVQVEIGDASGMVMMCPWAGYLRSNGNATARPNLAVFEGWQVRVTATQTNQGSAIRVAAHIHLSNEQSIDPDGGDFFYEAPRTGPGEIVTYSLGDPAAGAEYAMLTVQTCEAWLMRGMSGQLVCSATVNNRRLNLLYDDGANLYGGAIGYGNQTASQTTRWVFQLYGGQDPNTSNATYKGETLPEQYLAAGHRITFVTVALDATDNWGAGYMSAEVWAVPA